MGDIITYLSDVYREDRSLQRYLNESPRMPDLTKQKLAHIFNLLLDAPEIKNALGYPSSLSIRSENIPDMISSVDHMGVLSFPPFIDSNVVYGAWLKTVDPPQRFQWVLSCTGVPLNNASFPRGIFLAGQRVPLYPRKSERWCSWHVPGGHMQLKNLGGWGRHVFVGETLQQWIEHVRQFRLARAHEEMWVINHYLWKQFAPTLGLELMSISGEDVFTQWLSLNFGTWFHDFLFNIAPELRQTIHETFENCPGAWDRGMRRGTHLFWDVTEPGRERRPLVLEEKGRVLKNDRLELPLQRDAIVDALRQKKILPSLFTFFGLLSFDGGVVMAGGFNQLQYIYDMSSRWLKCHQQGWIPSVTSMMPAKALCGFRVTQAQGIEFLFENHLTSETAREILAYRLNQVIQTSAER